MKLGFDRKDSTCVICNKHFTPTTTDPGEDTCKRCAEEMRRAARGFARLRHEARGNGLSSPLSPLSLF